MLGLFFLFQAVEKSLEADKKTANLQCIFPFLESLAAQCLVSGGFLRVTAAAFVRDFTLGSERIDHKENDGT